MNRNATIRFLSQQFVDIIGYQPEELIGKEAFGLIHPDDIDRVKDEFNRVAEHAEYTATIEFRLSHTDGQWIDVEVTGRNLLDDSLVNGIIVNLRDISERRTSEKQLATLHETTRALIRANESNRVIRIATEAARDIVGLSICGIYRHDSESDTLEPGWLIAETYDLFDCVPTFNRGEGLAWQAYENGEVYVFEDVSKEIDRYNSDTKMRSELIIPLGDHGVLIAGDSVAGVFDDRTTNLARILAANVEVALDRINHHRTLLEREQELLRQNEQLEEFTSVVSHDLRNPLTVAMGRLELLADECESEQLPLIESSLSRMEELVEDLLNYVLVGESIQTDDFLNLADRIANSWNNVRTHDAQIDIQADVKIHASATRLSQLFENLIRNAIEHGGGDVTIRVGLLENGFFFEDDGPGIRDVEREKIFKAGYSTSATGTGFGLSIVRNVAIAHGWSVTVGESETGGARFHFTDVEFID